MCCLLRDRGINSQPILSRNYPAVCAAKALILIFLLLLAFPGSGLADYTEPVTHWRFSGQGPELRYILGIQEGELGTFKIGFICLGRGSFGLSQLTLIDSKKTAQKIVAGRRGRFFRVGEDFLPLDRLRENKTEFQYRNNWIISSYKLPENYVKRLYYADAVGFAILAKDPRFFYGFLIKIPSERKRFIQHYIIRCSHMRRSRMRS